MSRKNHASMSDEYMFLKNKTIKLLENSFQKPILKANRDKRRARKFIRRMQEIEKIHKDMGWPHPEAQFKPHPDVKEALETLKIPGKELLANPDGSLFEKEGNLMGAEAGFTVSTKGVMNPDGTPFETPVLEGAILTGDMHSEQKVQEFLEKKDDGFLRTED